MPVVRTVCPFLFSDVLGFLFQEELIKKLNKGERNINLKFSFLINEPAGDALKFMCVKSELFISMF